MQHFVLPSFGENNWRKSICLSDDLNSRLNGLSNAVIPASTLQQLQSRLDTAIAAVRRAFKSRSKGLDWTSITFQLPSPVLQLSHGRQTSAKQICSNSNANKIVIIQWAAVAFLLVLMLALYVAKARSGLLSGGSPKGAVLPLHLTKCISMLAPARDVLLRLAGVLLYWFDVGTDIYLLVEVLAGNSSWAHWVLLTILLLHYVVGAALLGCYFAANRRFFLVFCVLLVPVMPLVDTVAPLMIAAQNAGKHPRWGSAAVDWQAVFELRNALEFLLESMPMAILQTAIFLVGNEPGVGVYLDDWTYILAAAGSCVQILGMAGLVLWRAADKQKMPVKVLCDMLTLPERTQNSEEDEETVGILEVS